MAWQAFLAKVGGQIQETFGAIYDKIDNNLDYLKDGFDASEPTIYKQDTEPVSPEDNDLWIDTSADPHTFWRYDGTSYTWVQIAVEVIAHLLGSASHTADTLANLNTKISDATLDDSSATRTPAEHTNTKHTTNLVGEAGVIAALTGKTTPVDADSVVIEDSAHTPANTAKKLTWANNKATLKTYFDTLYTGVGSFLGLSDVTPSTYTGQAGKRVKVNAGETAVEFTDAPQPPRVVELVDDGFGGYTPNADTTDIAEINSTGASTLALPSGTPSDGQALIIRFYGAYPESTLTLNAGYNIKGTMGNITATGDAEMDIIGLEYVTAELEWQVVAYVKDVE